MSESLVHGAVRHHILVVSVAVSVSDLGRGVVGEGSVANTRRSIVEHSHRRDASIQEVQGGQSRHSGAQRVTSHHHSVGGELGLQTLDLGDHLVNDSLFSLVKTLVDGAARALGIVS